MSSIVNVRVHLVTLQRRAWLNLVLMSFGLLLALFAQRAIYANQEWTDGAVFYVIAFVALIASWLRGEASIAVPIREMDAAQPLAERSRIRRLLVVPAVLFAVIAFLTLVNNRFTLMGTTAWLTSLVLFLVAFWDGTWKTFWERTRARVANWTNLDTIVARFSWTNVLLLGILLIGAYFYFYRLDAVPAEMTSDHAEKIYDTFDILQGKYSIFFERNTGREPLQFYGNALVVALGITPLDHIALKTFTALMGLLAVPAVFLLAREWFDAETALYAAFFMAVSLWPVAIARVGLRYPLYPLFVALSLFFLARALRKTSRNDFLLAGLMMGLGLNGYSPFRVELLLAAAILVIWALVHRENLGAQLIPYLKNIGLMGGAMFLVFLPLFRYTVEHPQMFLYRSLTRLTDQEAPIVGNPIQIFADNVWNALLMVNVKGDAVWVNTLPNHPVVDYIIGALVLSGAIYAAYRLIRARELPYLFILIGIFILLLPSTLALAFPYENPSVVRAGGATPLVMILAALPLVVWQRQFRALGSRWLGVVLALPLLLWCAKVNSDLYFNAYEAQYRHSSWNTTEVAAVLKSWAQTQGDFNHIYVVSYPHWVDHRAIGIHLGDMSWDDHLIQDQQTLRDQKSDPISKLYALNVGDQESLNLLQELYPKGVHRVIRSKTPDRNFVTFYAPGISAPEQPIENPSTNASPTPAAPNEELVTESLDANGETLQITHSPFDSGRVNDLFDGTLDFLARGASANPLIIDIVFPAPRALSRLAVTLSNGEYSLHTSLYERPDAQPVVYDKTYENLPDDPRLEMNFDQGPAQVQRVRLEITMLNPPDEVHVHVREIEFNR